MSEFIEFETENGEIITVEVSKASDFVALGHEEEVPVSRSADKAVKKFQEAVKDAFGIITTVGNQVVDKSKAIKEPPQAIELKMNLKFAGKGGFAVAQLNAESSMEVKLTWNNQIKPAWTNPPQENNA